MTNSMYKDVQPKNRVNPSVVSNENVVDIEGLSFTRVNSHVTPIFNKVDIEIKEGRSRQLWDLVAAEKRLYYV